MFAHSDPFKNFVEENEMDKKHEDYPHKRRFCAIVDRRKGEPAPDDLIFFEPPENCCSFPEHKEGHVQLWYFASAKTCILPPKGYNKGQGNKNGNITTGTACHGGALTLSFHVESADEIRCYLFVNGGMMRFFPQDVIDVLPRFFDPKFGNNDEWAESRDAQELVERMSGQLVDTKFNAFHELSQ